MNRAVIWGEEGFGVLPDPRPLLKTAEGCDLERAKVADAPSSKHAAKGVREAEGPLVRALAMSYSSRGGFAQYLAADMRDIQEAV